jgi:multidrug efflux pump subunit AcrB
MLTYDGQQQNSSYSQILVDVENFQQIDRLQVDIQEHLDAAYPEALAKVWRFALGPGGGSKIEAQFKGPDPAELRRLAEEAKAIMSRHPNSLAVKDNWREPVQIMQPVVSETFASRVGLSQKDINESLQFYFGGVTVGTFRDGDKLLPIVGKVMGEQELGVDDLRFVQVWSASANTRIPVRQAMSEFGVNWEAPTIRRENRVPVIKAQSDPRTGLASDLLADIRDEIEAIELPPGYSMEWKGEAGNSSDAQGSLMASFPLAILAMWVITVFLFNALRQPAIIWLTVPLILIGIVGGLLLVPGSNFDFMALLGLLSLTGMLIKNAIVLVDQMDQEMRDGKHGMLAINDAAISRLRPVMMGTLTTVLGMIPLLADPFYTNMAITIMAGLTFATVLTLVVVPVLYSLFFGIRYQRS